MNKIGEYIKKCSLIILYSYLVTSLPEYMSLCRFLDDHDVQTVMSLSQNDRRLYNLDFI